jgi:lipopolysaccharide/colanic/teichoic acid biosynthesis glycosyltransferase
VGEALTKAMNMASLRNQSVSESEYRADPIGQACIRALDVTVSLTLIVALAPLLALVAVMIYFSDPGPIVFGHMRIGRGGRQFKCLKFRSMVTDAQERLTALLSSDPAALAEWQRDHKLKKDPRITGIGTFLRQSSLDELPQLFNVLRGEMSLVGPRPIVTDEVKRYRHYFRNYCEVRPGITGLWQVSGRNDVSYRSRVAMDVAYVRSHSLMLNLKILVMTVPSVLKSQGSY